MFQEFMNEPLNMQKRQQLSFSDEMVIRKAKIYKCMGAGNDKLKVQVLPELQDIDDEELEDLPEYPPFIKGTVVTGKSHVNDGKEAEFVWVLCTPDLQVGYVLGKANVFGEPNKKFADSYSYPDIKKYIEQRRAAPDDFSYNNMVVVQWVSTDKGGMIQCYNYLTGDWILLNTSGSVITVQQQRIYMRVGTPADPPSAVAHSSFTMTPDQIHMKAPNIEVDAQQLVLGKHNLRLAGLIGAAPAADNGVPVIATSNIYV